MIKHVLRNTAVGVSVTLLALSWVPIACATGLGANVPDTIVQTKAAILDDNSVRDFVNFHRDLDTPNDIVNKLVDKLKNGRLPKSMNKEKPVDVYQTFMANQTLRVSTFSDGSKSLETYPFQNLSSDIRTVLPKQVPIHSMMLRDSMNLSCQSRQGGNGWVAGIGCTGTVSNGMISFRVTFDYQGLQGYGSTISRPAYPHIQGAMSCTPPTLYGYKQMEDSDGSAYLNYQTQCTFAGYLSETHYPQVTNSHGSIRMQL